MFSGVAFWQLTEAPVTPGLTALNYGRWVVTRRNTGVNQRAAWSDDGITWNNATTPNSLDYYFSSFSPTLGIYVAGDQSSISNNLMTSTNGVTWTSRSKPTNGSLGPIEWCGGWNKFLMVSRGQTPSTTFNILSSVDGINWTQIFTQSGSATVDLVPWIWKSEFAETPFGYEWLGSYRVGASLTQSVAIYSSNGSSFTTYSIMNISGQTGFLYNKTLNTWMGWAAEGPTTTTAQIIISQTASSSTSWTRYTNQRAPSNALVFGVATTNDGQNGATASPARTVITNLSGAATTTPIRYSDTLANGSWTNVTLASAAYGFYDCAYSRALGQFLAVRTATNFLTSTNGSTWTSRTFPGTDYITGIFGEGIRTNGFRVGGT
jgi:hypothetical protein